MRKLVFGLMASSALFFAACNSAKTDNKEHNHTEMDMQHGEHDKNVMMEAMDKSMNEMMAVKPTENIDYDFASKMKPHHEGAVEMAEALIKESKNNDLIVFSKQVIEAQKAEIASFDEFLMNKPTIKSKNSAAYEKADQEAMMVMMDGMKNIKPTGDIDKDFVALMIPHHQSAVEMAKAYLPYAENPKLKQIAEDIVKSQTKEIDWLKTKL